MDKKGALLKPACLQEEDLAAEEQKVAAEAKEAARKKALADGKSKKKSKDDQKLPVDPKERQQDSRPAGQQNVTAIIQKAIEGQMSAVFKQQADLVTSLKNQQEQFMAQQNQKHESLQKRISTVIGAMPVQSVSGKKSQNQVWTRHWM